MCKLPLLLTMLNPLVVLQGCILLVSNPGVADGISGLACGASYQSAVDRHLLWQRRNETVIPYNIPVWVAVQNISNLRNDLDGPAVSVMKNTQCYW